MRRSAAMFHDHAVDRAYLALVRGSVGNDAFAVDAPLGRRASKIVVDATEGRRAETRFEVRERFDGATLLEAVPRTGRTHQIRVHLAAIGHPILGDRAYGGGGDDARGLGLDRPFLHAGRLSFAHPITRPDGDARRGPPGGPPVGPRPTPRAARLTAPGGDASVSLPRITGM